MKRYTTKQNYYKMQELGEKFVFEQQTAEDAINSTQAIKRLGWNKKLSFHDCRISAVKQKKNDIIFNIDNRNGFTDVDEITFHNAQIIEQEVPLANTCWIWDNIYYENGIFTLYVLLYSGESKEPFGLAYLTVTAENITLHYAPNYKKKQTAKQ